MLPPGSKAPPFILPDEHGREVALADLIADSPTVLYFYPADFTPVCTAEACAFRDMHPRLAAAGLRLAGVSPQGQQSHDRFRTRHNLPFTLLSDPEKRVIKAYRASGPFGFGTRRVSYLIGRHGEIEAGITADLSAAKHARFVERALGQLEAASDR